MSESRAPRRIVVLSGSEKDGEVEAVLRELSGPEVTGARLHAELSSRAAEMPGKLLAAEWLGPLGWTRFIWCRK
jgi:hypothetical protein